jgi:hypothetical protein
MSKRKPENEAVEKLDVESLIVDLLCCGLGGCIILFFIFSIKIIGPSFSHQKVAAAARSDKGSAPGFVSLIGDDGHGVKMGSFRIIHLYQLSDENLRAIKDASDKPAQFWDLTKFGHDKDLLASVRMQVEIRQKDISFILSADGMRAVTFRFPESLKAKLADTRPGSEGFVSVIFLEGQSARGDFGGYLAPDKPIVIESVRDLKISIEVGKVSNSVNSLIKLEHAKL